MRLNSFLALVFGFLALIWCLAGNIVQAQEDETTDKAVTNVVIVEDNNQVEKKKSANKVRAPLVSKIWWNQPQKVQELALSDAQREKMDAIFLAYLEVRKGETAIQKKELDAYGEALASGDASAIEAQAEKVHEVMTQPIREQTTMMAKVVAELTAKQRKELVTRYPQLLSHLWVLGKNPRSPSAGRGGRRS